MGKWPSLDKIEMDDDPIDKDDYEDKLEKLQHRLKRGNERETKTDVPRRDGHQQGEHQRAAGEENEKRGRHPGHRLGVAAKLTKEVK